MLLTAEFMYHPAWNDNYKRITKEGLQAYFKELLQYSKGYD
jgi:hypothetical protein